MRYTLTNKQAKTHLFQKKRKKIKEKRKTKKLIKKIKNKFFGTKKLVTLSLA